MNEADTFLGRHPMVYLIGPPLIAGAIITVSIITMRWHAFIGVRPALPFWAIVTAYPLLLITRIVQTIRSRQTRPMIAFLMACALIEAVGLIVLSYFIWMIVLLGGPINPG